MRYVLIVPREVREDQVEIDWTLLLLIVIAALFALGLVLALRTAAGRKRLGDAALLLAERLIAYAIRWLERDEPDVPSAVADDRLSRARRALGALQG